MCVPISPSPPLSPSQMELDALEQHRPFGASRSFHGGMPTVASSDPVDVQLHKSVAKATIKLGARVTTLEAKVRGRRRGTLAPLCLTCLVWVPRRWTR